MPSSPNTLRSLLSSALAGWLASCTGGRATTAPEPQPTREHTEEPADETSFEEALSDGGSYRLAFRSDPEPLPENEPFELEVRVERVDGAPVAPELALTADAYMPAHRHGMARQARTESLGSGRFVVRGMLLHMEGDWKLVFDLSERGAFEHVEFDVHLLPAAAREGLDGFTPEQVAKILELSPLPAVPDDPTNAFDTDEAAAHFGQFLFFERRMSKSGNVACSTCHDPELDWTDGKGLASATARLDRNTISLWNTAYGRWFFWDGRADSLWAQALKPLEDPREFAGDRASIVRLLSDDAELRRAYESIFGALPQAGDGPAVDRAFANVGKALAAFECKLVTRASPFDLYVQGVREDDPALRRALGDAERRGLALFIGRANCHLCHSGPNFSDREFHSNRVEPRAEMPLDPGRFQGALTVQSDAFNALGEFTDGDSVEAREKLESLPLTGDVFGHFKTPTLRNVARTAPYMHQGQLATLEQVVEFYSDRITPLPPHGDGERVLVPLHLSAEEKSDLVAFLESLSDPGVTPELVLQPAKPYLQ